MKPVIVQSGGQKYPLVRGYPGDGSLSGGLGLPIAPRIADDPCVCCPTLPGPCHPPCPSCTDCITKTTGVQLTISGTKASSCEPNQIPGEPRLVYYSLDGTYLCTRYDGPGQFGGKRFTCVLGQGTCGNPGLLDLEAWVGGPNHARSYISEIMVVVRCGGAGVEVTGPITTGNIYKLNCDVTQLPYGGQLPFGVFSAPWQTMCNEGGAAVLAAFASTVCDRTPYPVTLAATLL